MVKDDDWNDMDPAAKLERLMTLVQGLRGEIAAMKAVDSHTLVYADQINRTVRDLLRRLEAVEMDVAWRDDAASDQPCAATRSGPARRPGKTETAGKA